MSDPVGTAGAVQYYVNSSTFGGDKDKLFLDTSNVRLGIGTDSPVGTVHLTVDSGSTETAGLYIQNEGTATADDVSPIAFTTRSSDWGTVHAATIAAGTHSATSGGAYLVLKTSSTGQYAPSERLRITSAGNVGIGQSSPDTKLHIALSNTQTAINSYLGDGITVENSDTTNNNFTSVQFKGGDSIMAQVGAQFVDHSTNAGDLFFTTRNSSGSRTEKVRITSAGEVGIGTSSPSSGFKLDVDGKAIIRDDLNLYSDYCIQYWKKANGTDNLGWILNRDDNSCQYVWADGQDLRFLTTTTGGSTTERVRIDSNGKMLFAGSTQALSWPATTAESTSRAWAFIGEQGAYGRFELRRSASATTTATDGTSISTMAFDRNGNVGIGVTDLSASGANAKLGVASGFINVDDTYGLCWGGGTGRPNISGSKSAGTVTIDNVSVGVGIGGTPTDGPLHVFNTHTGAQRTITIENTSGGDASIQYEATGGSVWASGLDNSDSDKFKISQNELGDVDRFTIDTSGLVGIGTTSPARLLELSADTNSTVDLFRLTNADTTYSQSVDFSLDTNKDLVIAGSSGNGGIHFNMGSRGYTFSNGNVGIGMTPGSTYGLYVSGKPVKFISDGSASNGAVLELVHANSNTNDVVSSLSFANNVGGVARIEGGTSGGNTNGYISFFTDNVGTSTEKMRIDSSGNLGVGSSSPSGKLEVNTGSGIAYFTRTAGDDGSTNPALGIAADSTKPLIRAYGDGLVFETAATGGSASERLRIDSSGLVGIGSSSPSSYYSNANDLVVARNDHAGITIKTGTAHTGWLVFADGTASGDNTRGGISYDHNNDLMAFRVNNDRKVSIDSSGVVTVGGNASAADMNITSTGSTANLTVQGGEANIATIKLNSDDGDDASDITILEQSNGGPFKIKTNNGGSTAISCDSGGNVAIKQATASYALDVNGVINCTSLRFADGTSISTTPTGTVLLRDLNPAAFNYDMHVAGKVGIGNTNPGDFHGSASRLVIGAGSGEEGLTIYSGSSSNGVINFADVATSGSYQGRIIYDHSSNKMSFHTGGSGAEKMRITSAGNVGIGSTDPATKLEVTTSSSSGVTPLCVSNRDTTAGTGQSASISFGLARNSGAFKDKAGKIQVGRELDWTSDDAKIDAFMSFSVYQNNALSEKMRINSTGRVGIGATPSDSYKLLVDGNICASGGRLHVTGSSSTASGQSIYAPAKQHDGPFDEQR